MRYALAVALVFLIYTDLYQHPTHTVVRELDITPALEVHYALKRQEFVQVITKKYGIDPELADEVVKLAHKHGRERFPTPKDIIAIVGIESSFRPDVASSLSTDPAIGLMQIRPGVWSLSKEELKNVEHNIKHGSEILSHYYLKLGRKDNAIQAYNIGITAFIEGGTSEDYLNKYRREVALYALK